MRTLTIIIVCVGVLSARAAVAQERAQDASPWAIVEGQADTALMHMRLPEIVVSATRSRILLDESPSAVTVVDRQELERRGGQRLSAILQGVPGLTIRDLGGLHGVKTVASRGTASVHTLFLLGGLRLNSPQNGLVDLGLLTGEAFEQIEIVRGGQSGLYGADALGGLVHLVPRMPSDSLRLAITMETGSFGLWASRTDASWSMGDLTVAAGMGYERSEGDYRFVGSVDGAEQVLTRDGADSRFGTGYVHLRVPLSERTHVSAFASVSGADRGSPGPYTGSVPRIARLEDQSVQSVAQLVSSLVSLGTLSFSAGYQGSRQHFVDVTLMPGIDERYESSSASVAAQWNVPVTSSLLMLLVADAAQEWVTARQIAGNPGRTRWGLTSGLEIFSKAAGPLLPRLALYPTVRFDSFSDVGGRFSPRFGLNLWLSDDGGVSLRSSVGTSYRVPNFNELYWVDGGNPDLKPETALSVDAGLVLEINAVGRHSLDVGAFRISMEDRITGWPPVNVSSSLMTGLEMMWRWDLTPGGLYSLVTATMTRASSGNGPYQGKQLPFVPLWEGRAALGERSGRIRGELAVVAMSRRYTTFDNALALSTDPYAVISAWIEYTHPLGESRLSLRADLDNLLNADYEVGPSYPMPLRSVRLGLRLEL